jgi:hypothetical protein
MFGRYKENTMRLSEITGRAKKLTDKMEQLNEGRKYIDADKQGQIAIDTPHHAGQQVHGHLPDGRAVNKDGSPSHGKGPFRLTKKQAKALRDEGFAIKKSRIVEGAGNIKVTVEIDPDVLTFLIELRDYLNLPED